jgi:1-deoxy-D-xylulose-5-phosphate synthase
MAPKDEAELIHMLHTAVRYDDGPIALRYPRGAALGVPMPDQPQLLEIGRGEVLQFGERVALIGYGTGVQKSLAAAAQLAEQGITATVVDARFAKPLDLALLSELANAHELLVTVEEAARAGGFGSAVLEELTDQGVNASIMRIGLPDCYVTHGKPALLHEEVGFTGQATDDLLVA